MRSIILRIFITALGLAIVTVGTAILVTAAYVGLYVIGAALAIGVVGLLLTSGTSFFKFGLEFFKSRATAHSSSPAANEARKKQILKANEERALRIRKLIEAKKSNATVDAMKQDQP
ncbi:hypothetical protein LNV09_14680 [Paucibacter sp. B2R-40]|uniref:hypothetical protein n=1 Tax=Paucibacter sp. B2R-40 TaxID=2893554 RepID=UPI0021E455CD|nr:hypothetical protein [Paucibacter sp. B2R-40]MCV2355397.1 hypothetical protein [Paucibacter sp. B2R-40]